MAKYWKTPGGIAYNLYLDMLEQTDLLVMGFANHGRVNVAEGLIHTALFKSPERVQFVLLNMSHNLMGAYKDLPHVIAYEETEEGAVSALKEVLELVERRQKKASVKRGPESDRECHDSHIYVFVEEYRGLFVSRKKEAWHYMRLIAGNSSSANTHLFAFGAPNDRISDVEKWFSSSMMLKLNIAYNGI